ncbi:MAG: DNA repair protein RecO [Candidatus Buchananbacteria bacterium]
MSTYQTTGIILKISDRGEADQVFSIYTKSKGKILALGKGTKKIQSKLNGQLQYFSLVYLMIAPGKMHDHIASAEIVLNHPKIKSDLKKIILASFALELVEKMTRNGQPEPDIFLLLENFFKVVENETFDAVKINKYKRMFVVKLLGILGFAPPVGIINSEKKLTDFLTTHLEMPLLSVKLLAKIKS